MKTQMTPALTILAALAGPAAAADGPPHCLQPVAQAAAPAPLGLAASSADPVARALFDAGLTAYWSGDAPAALHAFRAAQASDPSCALCHWGEALALGPRAGTTMPHAHIRPAWEAILRAESLAHRATDLERDLIAALRHRYGVNPMVLRESLDDAWAAAMDGVARSHRSVGAVQLLSAEAKAILRHQDAPG